MLLCRMSWEVELRCCCFMLLETARSGEHPNSVVITRRGVDAVASNCEYVSRLEMDC